MKTLPDNLQNIFAPHVGSGLFAVRPGIPLALAASESAHIVGSAIEVIHAVASELESSTEANQLWVTLQALTAAHHLIEAIECALTEAEQQGSDQ